IRGQLEVTPRFTHLEAEGDVDEEGEHEEDGDQREERIQIDHRGESEEGAEEGEERVRVLEVRPVVGHLGDRNQCQSVPISGHDE
ncbi:MAG: hypothetical protein ACK559_39185, partial [bacterium]